MYVNILSFKLNEKDGISSNELSMFEDNSKPKGLDRFHIFKDHKKENKFYLIEYWTSILFKNRMENSSNFPYLNKIHKLSNEKNYKKIECDIVI
jgi:quinol monooxygenase YgiN